MLTPPVHACTGKLFGPSGDWGDHFRVHAEVGQVITILVEATEGDLWDACIWDAEGRGTCMMPNGYVPGEQGIANHVVTTAGDHTIGLDGWSDDDITYQLSVYVH